ncbi:DoxX family protein [Streptomyces monticola]|uniref:DoxX family protein n=1 Tax=Streptomyces monticola TaxID=2666263 RepID=A0ABW2JM24_9ACTN
MSEAIFATAAAPSTTTASAADRVDAGAPVRGRGVTIGLRVLRVLFALFYGWAGVPKVIGDAASRQGFREMGFADWSMHVIGGLEVLGAIALLIPLLSGISALAFSALMVGASLSVLTTMGGAAALMPLLLIVPLAGIARAQRRETAKFVKLLRQAVRRA